MNWPALIVGTLAVASAFCLGVSLGLRHAYRKVRWAMAAAAQRLSDQIVQQEAEAILMFTDAVDDELEFDVTAEAIARVVRDMRDGNWTVVAGDPEYRRFVSGAAEEAVVIDSSAIYSQLNSPSTQIDVYDHETAPPYPFLIIGAESQRTGNVHAYLAVSIPAGHEHFDRFCHLIYHPDRSQQTEPNEFDWEDVGWLTMVVTYVGGRSAAIGWASMETTGPHEIHAVVTSKSGRPLDIRWLNQSARDNHGPLCVVLRTLDFLNCRNIIPVEPVRPRHERRRIERTGVRVHELVVRAVRKSATSRSDQPVHGDVPFHSVRGHFSHYGPEYGTGLLFGRHSGRFWMPAHARGNPHAGVVEKTYRVEA